MDSKVKSSEKKHPLPLFLVGLVLLLFFLYIIFSFSPSYVMPLGILQLSIVIPTLILLFLTLYTLAAFFFVSAIQGIVIATIAILYLILSYFGLNQWIFAVLLLGVFTSIELAIYKKK